MLSLGMRRDFIIFVTGILMLALCLIFCKPGKRTKYRFIRLSAGNLLIHLMDGLITFVNTPDLKREWNPLVRIWGFGWEALFAANLIGFVFIVLATWYFGKYEHISIPSKNMFDYYMKLFYGENYKPIWVLYKHSKNWKSQFALIGYACYWGVTIGALFPVIGWIWDMLDVDIPWWHSAYLSMGVGVVIALYQCCVWTREGYLKGRE
ncbi:MAG: hypothetical protein HFI10_00625 [Lachnospiraceae bacterium]|jgi:hypothetical protein|nr:hypothetical protein [Lachnospiraceae bacterium]